MKTTLESAKTQLEAILTAEDPRYPALKSLDYGLALKIAQAPLIRSIHSSHELGYRISGSDGLRSVDLVVVSHLEPSRDDPNPPCMIECYALYAILEGKETEVLKIKYNIAEVWRSKQFGELRIRRPTSNEINSPDFDPLSMVQNEVISQDHERLDPLADLKIESTVAVYLKAAYAAAKGIPVRHHGSYLGKNVKEDVTKEVLMRKEEAARGILFQSKGIATESIPNHLLQYASSGPVN